MRIPSVTYSYYLNSEMTKGFNRLTGHTLIDGARGIIRYKKVLYEVIVRPIESDETIDPYVRRVIQNEKQEEAAKAIRAQREEP